MTVENPEDAALAEALLKEAFVREWLRTGDVYKAGLTVFPSDTGRAMRAAWEWPNDPDILAYKQELIIENEVAGHIAGMPTKHELAREIYLLAQSSGEPLEERLAAYELSAKIMGYIERPSLNVNNNTLNVTNNRVMVIKDHGDDASWESAAARQQRGLLEKTDAKPN